MVWCSGFGLFFLVSELDTHAGFVVEVAGVRLSR